MEVCGETSRAPFPVTDVAIWFDGGGVYGFGNIRRSMELASNLSAQALSVTAVPLSIEAANLAKVDLTDCGKASVVVLDVPYCGDAWVALAQKLGARVLALDYEGSHFPDLVISLQAVRSFPDLVPAKTGVEFAIIREEIREAARSEYRDGREDEVLIVLGGGDSGALTGDVLSLIPRSVPCCVIQGPLGGEIETKHPLTRVLRTPPDLPVLMNQCAWAVTTGGTTMLEFLHLGKAIHVVPRTRAEQVFASKFLQLDALLGIGLGDLRQPPPEKITECGFRGRSLVDGRGCERIVHEVRCLLA